MSSTSRHSWETLDEAIPRGQSDRIAPLLGVTGDEVRRWRREPESNDAPTASGRRSPLDRFLDLLDAVYLVHPAGARLIVEDVRAHLADLQRTHNQSGFNERETASRLCDHTASAVHTLLDGKLDREDMESLTRMRAYLDEQIEALRAAQHSEPARIDARRAR